MKRAFLDRELCEAAERGNAAAVKKLIARGADVNTPGTEDIFLFMQQHGMETPKQFLFL